MPKRNFIHCVSCLVCGDVANDHVHYGSVACFACRAFFRRTVNKTEKLMCKYHSQQQCEINISTRKLCPSCRYQKSLAVGMKPEFVMSEQDKLERSKKRGRDIIMPQQTSYERRRFEDRYQRKMLLKTGQIEVDGMDPGVKDEGTLLKKKKKSLGV